MDGSQMSDRAATVAGGFINPKRGDKLSILHIRCARPGRGDASRVGLRPVSKHLPRILPHSGAS